MIAVITPWRNGVGSLLEDYARAVDGTFVVTVDNASEPADASALEDYTTGRGVYVRNERNMAFAPANNQGYAAANAADDDIVVFVNNDVAPTGDWLAHVARDVRHGALYGPSLHQQLVAGMWLPYLEGWCIAATAATWKRLTLAGQTGPWDSIKYPQPYWEDNDLCLRALASNIQLVQTAWPLAHKGGQTAGPLLRHAQSFESNRATFAKRALRQTAGNADVPMTDMMQAYIRNTITQSDIQHHLSMLFSLARGRVLELGTRTGVSTTALLAGVELHGGHVTSIDIDPRSAGVAAGHPHWTFVCGNTVANGLVDQFRNQEPFDLLLVDTLHTHAHVKRELELWAPLVRPGGVIAVHDTETFPGVRVAVEQYCFVMNLPVTFVLPCNGMAFITVPDRNAP